MKSPNVKKASLSKSANSGSKMDAVTVDSVGSPVNVRKASLSSCKGKPDQLGNPKRGMK